MICFTKMLLVPLLVILLLCSEICESKKSHLHLKKKKKNSPNISATFKMMPFKNHGSPKGPPKGNNNNFKYNALPSSLTTLQDESPFLFMHSPFLTQHYTPFSPQPKFDFRTSTAPIYLMPSPRRRSDDFFAAPFLDMSSLSAANAWHSRMPLLGLNTKFNLLNGAFNAHERADHIVGLVHPFGGTFI